ncbi:amidohydrolase [candidate division KSB1 bacterium]|nr:amidohydrolase [candidate division KSB1 bacterium]
MILVGNAWTGRGPVRRRRIALAGDRIREVSDLNATEIVANARELPAGALIIPGLHDAHLHLLEGGLKLGQADFHGCASDDDFAARLSDYIAQHRPEPGAWIEGHRLDETRLLITRTQIDRICPDHPVFIWSHDLHSAFVNSAALIRARVDGQIKHPAGGTFERDAGGKLSGVLRETAAYRVRAAIPPVTMEVAQSAFLRAQQLAVSHGFTGLSCSVRGDLLPHYLAFAESADQQIRMNIWSVTERFDLAADRFTPRDGTKFRLRAFKGFLDGALGSRTAAFWQSYEHDPEHTGLALVREGPLARFIRGAHEEGYQIALHAIGDRANSMALDAFEMAGCAGIGPALRPRIEHCQVLRERDIERFAELGVIASMQPIHCTADMRFVESRIGPERAKRAYAWRSLLDHGATLAFGSDWPVEDLNPFAGIHAAVTRTDDHGEPAGGWQPQERITIEETLRAYTRGSAFAAGWEEELGEIAVGKLADLTVVDRDLFSVPPQDTQHAKALLTVVGGEVVYDAM